MDEVMLPTWNGSDAMAASWVSRLRTPAAWVHTFPPYRTSASTAGAPSSSMLRLKASSAANWLSHSSGGGG
jgi:hypothetical protein